MFGLGYQELLLILLIVLILFGAQRLPDLARSLGSSFKEFKKGVAEAKDEGTSRRCIASSSTRRFESAARRLPSLPPPVTISNASPSPPASVCRSP